MLKNTLLFRNVKFVSRKILYCISIPKSCVENYSIELNFPASHGSTWKGTPFDRWSLIYPGSGLLQHPAVQHGPAVADCRADRRGQGALPLLPVPGHPRQVGAQGWGQLGTFPARSLVPCQDSPSVKATYTASITGTTHWFTILYLLTLYAVPGYAACSTRQHYQYLVTQQAIPVKTARSTW